jgi:HSP20 family protein
MQGLQRSQPIAPLAGWPARSRIDRLFDHVVDEAVNAIQPASGFAAANLYESPEAYLVELPLPGVKAEDVELTVRGDRLTVQARRRWEAPPNAQPIWRGFGTGELQETVTLPGEVEIGAVQAELQDGILRLDLPKAERTRAHTITVNGAGRVRDAPSAVSVPATGVAEAAHGEAPLGSSR